MIQPADIQAIVFDGAGPLIQPLAEWIVRFPGCWLASQALPSFADCPRGSVASPGFIGRMRNLAWHLFTSISDRPWFLMVDDDQIPVPETDALFKSPVPYPVMGARYFAKNGTEAHPEDGFVALGCLLVHRQAVEMIGADPFTANADEGCECMAFARRVREAGLWPKHVGAIGHRVVVDVLPADGENYQVRFPTGRQLLRPAKDFPTSL